MKRKLLIIWLLLFIMVFNSKAQYAVGFDIGYSNNHLNTNISNRSFTQNKNGNGVGAGLALKYNYSKKINFQTGITLLQKNYSFVRTGNYAGIYEDFKNTYLQLPLIVQFKILDPHKLKFFIDGGLFFSYWAFAKVLGATPNIFDNFDSVGSNGQMTQYFKFTSYSEKHNFNNLKDNRFEFGWIAGISASYDFNKKYSSFINGRIYNSICDQQKKYMINQVPKYNQTIFISAGCLMNLPGKKFTLLND